ncbi:tail fiber protein [Maricaulis sp.]|uniref:phage tail protein n=1 Tax=Maricaulis sp. TaxID=1486257 RepID=UPI0025BD9BA8|nr:tail fiber protein [Maricaulis sp.]
MLKHFVGAAVLGASALAAPSAMAQSEPFVGQITPFANTFCPRGWMEANGSLLPIAQNDVLFSLFGTTYGGDGRSSFGIPDLRGRMAVGQGQAPGLSMRTQGSAFGADSVTLTVSQMPNHNHSFRVSSSSPNQASIGNATLATFPATRPAYAQGVNMTATLNTNAIYSTGGNLSINIQQPYNTVRWCVATVGIYPSRN